MDKKQIIIDRLKKEYWDSEVCMAELLADSEVPNCVSFETAFEIYIEMMKWAEGDKFYTIKEDEEIEL